ncbi:MAG: hypothetical protein H5T66_09610, partial [Chloroflexi bacterium]|nr:hypothetical protein [Chloroflexota bacterium]
GRVEQGAIWVGRAPYRAVVIPPDTRTLFGSTVDLLERFLASGGRVIAIKPLPTLINAEPTPRLEALWAREGVIILEDVSGLQAALERAVPRRVSLLTPKGQEAASLLYMQREFEGRFAYFIVNGDRHNGYDIRVTLEGSGRLEEWDPLTGAMRGVPAIERDGKLCFQAQIGPAGSKLYVVDPTGQPEPGEAFPRPPFFRAGRVYRDASFIGPTCSFTRTDPNVLTLDMCRYRLRDGDWSEVMEVWRAQHAIRQALGMRPNYYNGLPQRYKWAIQPHPQDGAPVALRFTFQVQDVPAKPVYLLVEGAEQFEIWLNGQKVSNLPTGWYLDRSFHKVLLPALQAGENWLELRCAYTNSMELEDCFLIGDFGVSRDRVIIREPTVLHFGDWTTQGYPHYAGSMIYHGQFMHTPQANERVKVYLGEYEAVDVAVYVNGTLVGHIPWAAANGLDITDALGPGANNVDIEVVSSPRNMLGPLHLAPGRESWTDWRSFRRTDETFTPHYVLKAWGLIGQVRLQREKV